MGATTGEAGSRMATVGVETGAEGIVGVSSGGGEATEADRCGLAAADGRGLTATSALGLGAATARF
jgi:hypothetical protein